MKRPRKLPRDLNQLAAEVVRLSTTESEPEPPRPPITEYLSEIGRKRGIKCGPARAKKLSKKKLREIGKKTADVR